MSVRIGAHAITWVALGPLTGAAVAGSPATPVAASVEASPDQVARWRVELPMGLDHGTTGVQARLLATPDVLTELERRGVTVTRTPTSHLPPEGYRLPPEGGDRLRELALEAGSRGGHAVLGFSVQGRPIDALWVGQPPESGAPVHRVLAAHHGDEWSSFEVALATAEALVAGDGADPAITAALDVVTVWVVPYVNPDGVAAMSRWNARTVDLNRNYDYAWTEDEFLPGPEAFSEPETRAVRAFSHWTQPLLSVSLHSGASNFGWVWNHTTHPAADVEELRAQALRYQAHTTDRDFWVTNGAAWYVSHGDTNDWSYGRHGVWDSTVELTVAKTPPSEDLDGYVTAHLGAMIDFVTILPDVSARVVDDRTGRPIDAEVRLRGADGPTGSWFRTEPATGAFHRLTAEPVGSVEVRAAGYLPMVADLGFPTLRLTPDRLDPRPALPAPATSVATLPVGYDGSARLVQPGHADRVVDVHGGAIDARGLAGGAWTVIRDDGVVHRHGLLVSDAVRARVDRWERVDDTLIVEGAGFESGARAWVLSGLDRARTPSPVLTLTLDRIELGAEALDGSPASRHDLWLLVAGEHLFVGDLTQADPPAWDPGASRPDFAGSTCACSVKTGHLPSHAASWILAALLWLLRRHV